MLIWQQHRPRVPQSESRLLLGWLPGHCSVVDLVSVPSKYEWAGRVVAVTTQWKQTGAESPLAVYKLFGHKTAGDLWLYEERKTGFSQTRTVETGIYKERERERQIPNSLVTRSEGRVTRQTNYPFTLVTQSQSEDQRVFTQSGLHNYGRMTRRLENPVFRR